MKLLNINNITKILFIVAIFIISENEILCQQKYSVDEGRLRKSGRVGLTYHAQQRKQKKQEREELRTKRKEKRAIRKAKREHMKKLQTKSTRKQMKKLYRSSVRINKHKPQEYLHERLFSEVFTESKIILLKSKIVVKNSFGNIKNVFANSTNFDKRKKKCFKIEKN